MTTESTTIDEAAESTATENTDAPPTAAEPNTAMIEAIGLSKFYGEFAASRNVNFKINQGELIFMVGGNGSGKSTFLKVLTGLYPPDTGTIKVNDITITHKELQGYRNLMAPIFTDFHLFDKLYGIDPIDAKTARKALEHVELTDKTDLKEKNIKIDFFFENTVIKIICK